MKNEITTIKYDDKLIGKAILEFYSSPFSFALFRHFIIHPEFQGEGLGTNLFKKATNKIISENILGLVYRDIKSNEIFYNGFKKNGWKKVISEEEWFYINKRDLSIREIYSAIEETK